jgi:hypothetical protein
VPVAVCAAFRAPVVQRQPTSTASRLMGNKKQLVIYGVAILVALVAAHYFMHRT